MGSSIRYLDTYVYGPENSRESWPELALQSPEEPEEVPLLEEAGAVLGELATTAVLAAAMGIEVVVGEFAGLPAPW